MSEKNKDELEQEKDRLEQEKEKEPTFEDLMADLPLSDKSKKVVAALFGGLASNLTQINNRLATLETKGDSTDPSFLEGLTQEQKYNILMAKYAAPAQAAQTSMLQTILGSARGGGGGVGGGGGSEIDRFLSSADKIKALKDVFSPEPSPVQIAMEKAQVASVLAQTRLMNKVAGKQTTEYLDKLEKDLTGGSEAEE